MRWEDLRQSTNVENRGGMGGGAIAGGGGIAVLLIAGVVYLLGGDPSVVLNQAGAGSAPGGQQVEALPETDERLRFARAITASTEDVWSGIFSQQGQQYPAPRVVSYRQGTQTGCGAGQAAMGPFYCPADQRVYIDLDFFQELTTRFGGGGDFAQAYVIAHEVGHHVQHVTGATETAERLGRQGADSGGVRLELQADCYAGVWAARANAQNRAQRGRDLLEPGDVEEGMRAASAIGDDTLQRSAGRAVNPESFSHGSSEQRMRWLRRGLQTGDPAQCDTFGTNAL